MTMLILALLITAADPKGAAPASAPSAVQPNPAATAAAQLKAAQDTYDRAVQLYKDSCEERAYGAYDDLCGQLRQQIHQYRVDLDRQERLAGDQAGGARPHS